MGTAIPSSSRLNIRLTVLVKIEKAMMTTKKWPEVLEDAFLDALMYLPKMGRRKFSYEGKPHGRNELIRVYLWLAYLESLPPGARPDESMRRTRKQVSSHIQVLKGFFKGHPAYGRLFPEKDEPKNGFQDSFKDDPCLRALSMGRLPKNKYDCYDEPTHTLTSHSSSMKPVLFWLLMTSSSLSHDDRHHDVQEEDLYNEGLVTHKFSRLSAQRQRASLDTIPSWRQRFPYLQQLYTSGELDCEIIHMEASLNLLTNQPPEGSELCSRMVLSVPGRQHDTEWRIVTTLSKPPELYRDQRSDPPLEAQPFAVDVTSINDNETRIKVPFPASPWAQAFSCLRNIQAKYEEKQAHSFNTGMGSTRPARDYVDLISMYQEVQSAAGPHSPFVRRTIIIWTFRQASSSDRNGTFWRYVDPAPVPRRMCMSPSPHPSHHLQANMNENFNSWSDTPMHLQQANIDNFLMNSHVHLKDFEHASQSWQLPVTRNFDNNHTWANYTVPSTTPVASWDSNEAKTHAWPDLPADGKSWEYTVEEPGNEELNYIE